MPKIALLTITNDPKGKNRKLFNKLLHELEDIYSELYIAISDKSSAELVKAVEKSRFNVRIIPANRAAQARREVVKFGLIGDSQYYHYCDLDRLLTWGENHLEGLKAVTSQFNKHDYLILGRTERAFYTHPNEWIETEKITNKICSLEIGKEVDITAGSCSFSREAAIYINKYSKDKMTDSEWAMIVHRIAKLNVDYQAVEGLEYHEETNGVSRNSSDSEKWFGSLKLSYIISGSAMQTGK